MRIDACMHMLAGLQQTGAAFSRDGRFFGAATFTSDVKLYEVKFSREGNLQGIEKVMDLKRAHTSQVRLQHTCANVASRKDHKVISALDIPRRPMSKFIRA